MREFRRDLSVVGRIVQAPATELHNQSINVNLEFSCRFEAIIMFAHVAGASKTFLERHFRHIIADDGNESALAPGDCLRNALFHVAGVTQSVHHEP